MTRSLDRARAGLQAPAQRALDVVGGAAHAAFGAAARLRGGKAVHPTGVVYEGVLTFTGSPLAPSDAPLLATAGEHRALVRFSRSLGLPRPLVDLLGMSIRLLDVHGPGRHQDFMLVSSADAPVLHHGFLPARDYQARPFTSSLPYRAGDERFIVGTLPQAGSPRPQGANELDRLARAAATGQLHFDFAVAPLLGRFQPIGELHIGHRLPQALDATHFNPWNTGGGIEPDGFLNRLRGYAYPGSQEGWSGEGG